MKWEYLSCIHVFKHDAKDNIDLIDYLNSMGMDEWELFEYSPILTDHVTRDENGYIIVIDRYKFLFKREITGESNA